MKKKNGNPAVSSASDGCCEHHILCAAEAIEERTDLDWHYRSTTHTEDLRQFYEQSSHQLCKGKWALLTLSLSFGCIRHVNAISRSPVFSFKRPVYTSLDELVYLPSCSIDSLTLLPFALLVEQAEYHFEMQSQVSFCAESLVFQFTIQKHKD